MTDIEMAEGPSRRGDSNSASQRSHSPYDISTSAAGHSGNASPQVTTVEPDGPTENALPPAAQEVPAGDVDRDVLPEGNPNAHSRTSITEDHLARQQEHHPPGRLEHGIYWRSPLMMIATAALGMGACVVHGVFYMILRGRPANPTDQEKYVRGGSFLAWLAQIFLSSSLWLVYTQCLWLSLEGNPTSLKTIDAATTVQSSFLSLGHFWLFWNLKIAYVLAIVAWCLQLPSLVTPATLVVVPALNVTKDLPVPVPDITNASLSPSFTYDTPLEANQTRDTDELKVVGPRTIVETIGAAVASSGRIADIAPPFAGYSYQGWTVSFYGPYVTCSDADPFQTKVINETVNQRMRYFHGNYVEVTNAYSAFIPTYGPAIDVEVNTTTVTVEGVQVTSLWAANIQRPLANSTNEIWMRFYRYPKDGSGQYIRNSSGHKVAPNLHFLTCKLYNASYTVGFSWNDGVQTVTKADIEKHEPVYYPVDVFGKSSDLVAHSYTAVFYTLANEVVGSMGICRNEAYNSTRGGNASVSDPPLYSALESAVTRNSLVGSDDLDFFFAMNKQLFKNNSDEPLKPQRLQDKAVAKNQTLDWLIPDLAFNITISLLHDPLLARNTTASVTRSVLGNVYDFAWHNLVIAYSLACAAAVVANLMGWRAYKLNGAAFDSVFSTVVSATRGAELREVFPECCQGVLPLPKESLDAKLNVERINDGSHRRGRRIVPVEMQTPLCRACNPAAAAAATRAVSSDRRFTVNIIRRSQAGTAGQLGLPTTPSPSVGQPPDEARLSETLQQVEPPRQAESPRHTDALPLLESSRSPDE